MKRISGGGLKIESRELAKLKGSGQIRPPAPQDTRRAEITRELVRSMTRSRHFNDRTSTYAPPTRAIPRRVKKLLQELEELQGGRA